ncbi:rhamnogalacturonan acetylesterase [Streptomyces justiciae]|uniref:rhamnogalacturonan acetylesterase n=1 Tax=Streptomyces justiciae TaxID=2780140 RepID=UPI001881D4CE|nr:rhamnogalacturonan acetylesterase [Streptomyces justiciae]MBE8472284.1 rhamnogalacturonan acetylesterase [Streptomyces justiciae]
MSSLRPARKTAGGLALLTALTALTAVTAQPASAHGSAWPSPASHCTGTAPVVCHFDVPPGTYDVSVLLGGDTAGSTSVSAEQRRAVLGETVTAAGDRAHRSFTVDVRAVEGEPTGEVGSPGLDLRFEGSAPRIAGLKVTPATHARQILLAGDSTVCDQPLEPYTGWGQQLPQLLRRGISIANHADSGESTVSFLANPLLFDQLETSIHDGDLVLIQLAHNDKTTTADVYRANLTAMAERVEAHGGQPVFVTPIVRRRFNSDGTLNSVALHVMAADLPNEIRSLAAQLGVPLVDLTQMSKDLVEGLGVEASKDLYLTNINGDNTHTSAYGAKTFAGLVLGELERQGLVPERQVR